jgi:hypothetical protein
MEGKIDAMSAELEMWRKKLDYLQQQEAVLADPAQKFTIGEQIKEAKAKISEMETADGGEESIAPDAFRAEISRIIKYAPAKLIGREAETKILSDAWGKVVREEKGGPRVLTFVALGGEGKTSLVAKWAADLAHQGWLGCEGVFAWSFYSQGTREQMADSSDLFLKEALTFFGDPEMGGSAQGAFNKGRRLAQLVGARQALLILDGIEPLQYAPTSPTPGELKDEGLAALLKGLATSSRGLCVVTTRYSVPDLKGFWETSAPQKELKRLSMAAGVALLQNIGVRQESGSIAEFEKLVEDVKGHALTVNLLGAYLRDAHAGDIRKRDLVKLEEADAEEQGGHAFRVMDEYVRWFQSEGDRGHRALAVLRILGLFDRPATADCLAALLQAPAIAGMTKALVGMSEAQRNLVFTRLEAAKLLTVNWDAAGVLRSLDSHPLLREYFARERRKRHAEAWRAAHRRLYEHLCAITSEKLEPTLEDLGPLYQAVAHGCQAGMQQRACDEVYFARIQRGQEYYSVRKLGALGSDLGAVACFFEAPWSHVSPVLTKAQQSWMLNEAAFRLAALGRLNEALEPARISGEMDIKVGDWTSAAVKYGNLSELNLRLGEVVRAVADAEQSVAYAERSASAFQRIVNRTTHADALHQAGHRSKAEARFREAETLQVDRQPDSFLVGSIGGFRYCDLLLAAPERSAWQITLHSSVPSHSSSLPESCRAVSRRAAQTFKWMQAFSGASLLDAALDNLTVGRAALLEAILQGSSIAPCHSYIQTAVEGLRRAGQQYYLPCGLLTRAWLRSITGACTDTESTQSDLDEAREIAERGPMPLFMADIHLHRARLFGRPNYNGRMRNYPWESPKADLAEARRLIEKHGYWRRKEELEDAEGAILRENGGGIKG